MIERLGQDESQYVRAPVATMAARLQSGQSSQVGHSQYHSLDVPGASGFGERRSSSASLLIRADSDTTVKAEPITPRSTGTVSSGTVSAPADMMIVPWDSSETANTAASLVRRVSAQQARGLFGLKVEPVKVGMTDPFSANFGRALSQAQRSPSQDASQAS